MPGVVVGVIKAALAEDLGSTPSTHVAAHGQGKLAVAVYTLSYSTQKAEDIWEAEEILVYVASSRPGEATGLDIQYLKKKMKSCQAFKEITTFVLCCIKVVGSCNMAQQVKTCQASSLKA